MSASSSSIADLYTVLRTDDTQFIAAAQRDATAMEEVATASEATSAKVKAGAAEQTVAAEKSAAATEVSTSRMGKGWKGLTSAIQEHGSKTTQVWSKVTSIGKASAIGLLAIGTASVVMASNFEATMELVHTQAGESQSAIKGLSQAVLALAPTVGIGPEKLAEGLYHLESTGFRGKEAMDILAASAKGAAIGMADLDTMSKGVAGIMSTAPKDIANASDAVALLNATVGAGDMRMQDLVSALSTGVLPAFKSAQLGAKDMAAALATLTDNGANANESATRLRMTVALMSAPSGKAAAALHSIGIGQSQLANDMAKPNGLLVAVQDLHDHLKGLSKVQANQVLEHAFGGGRSSAAIMTLVQETDRLKSKYGDLGNSTTRAAKLQDAWTQTQKTSKQQLHELGAGVQKMGIELGQKLLPPLNHMVSFLTSHKSAMNAFFIVLVAGMAAFTIAVIANTVAMLANPAVWIVIAIVAAIALLVIGIYLLVKHWNTVWAWIKKTAESVWHALVAAWNASLKAIEDALTAVGHWFNKVAMSIWHPIVDAWHWAEKTLKDGLKRFQSFWGGVWDSIGGALKWVYDHTLKPIFDTIAGAINSVKSGINSFSSNPMGSLGHMLGFADGGWVPGAPGAPQLAVVHGGEFVLSRDMLAGTANPGPLRAAPPSAASGGGGRPIIVQNTFMVDGRVVLRSVTTQAQRVKGRNTTTFLG